MNTTMIIKKETHRKLKYIKSEYIMVNDKTITMDEMLDILIEMYKKNK